MEQRAIYLPIPTSSDESLVSIELGTLKDNATTLENKKESREQLSSISGEGRPYPTRTFNSKGCVAILMALGSVLLALVYFGMQVHLFYYFDEFQDSLPPNQDQGLSPYFLYFMAGIFYFLLFFCMHLVGIGIASFFMIDSYYRDDNSCRNQMLALWLTPFLAMFYYGLLLLTNQFVIKFPVSLTYVLSIEIGAIIILSGFCLGAGIISLWEFLFPKK